MDAVIPPIPALAGSMRILLIVPLLLIVGCADRERVDRTRPTGDALAVLPVLVGTTRALETETGIPNAQRSADPSFGRFDVVIPPRHVPGRIGRPRREQPFDPARHFALAGSAVFDRQGFRAELARALDARPAGQREAILFVHGFNTSFIEGVYRVAQLGHDLRLPGVLLHYSWPSLGAPLAYAHDRDSALFARDGLEAMIRDSVGTGAPRLVLVGHSMGGYLLMETLRQIAMQGDRALLDRIGGVILISPDLDVDVFRMQARAIGNLPQPFLIVTSQRDRILRLSAQLTGLRERLGNLSGPEPLEGLEVTILDVSAFSTGVGHFDVARSPALIGLLDQVGAIEVALSGEAAGRLPLLPATILTLQNTTQIILQPMTDPRRRFLLPGFAEAATR